MDKTSFDAGKTAGKTEEKSNQLLDKAGGAAEAVKNTAVSAGQQVQGAAVGAVEAVKNATGMNKK